MSPPKMLMTNRDVERRDSRAAAVVHYQIVYNLLDIFLTVSFDVTQPLREFMKVKR